MPILCAHVPDYKVALARLWERAMPGCPIIVVDRLERGHVVALDEEAQALGARTGMTLVAAAACAREAAVVVDDPARGRVLWERALDALDAASPLVEDTDDGTALLDMRGIAGCERDWLTRVHTALAHDDELRALPLHAALGPNPFVARIAAQTRDGTVVRAGEERAFVAPVPLHVLHLERETLERLELLGVRTLGELAALPHGPFVRRFGSTAAHWHALACGDNDKPLVPRTRRVTVDHALLGEGTAEREDQLLFALRTLVVLVAEDLTRLGKRCGALRLDLEGDDGETHVLQTALAQPTAQSATLFDLLRARLEGTVLRAPVSGLRLRAERLEEGGAELSLFAGRDPDPDIVALALARLGVALGDRTALRARIMPGHRYESRVAYEPFTVGPTRRAPTGLPTPEPCHEQTGAFTYRLVPARSVAVRLQHGRPAFVGPHAVLEYTGPWRVDEAWWAPALIGGTRCAQDAYDVLLADGMLCRIVAQAGQWFIHGMYD